MLHLEAPRGLHHVEGANDVAVYIGARVFKAVAHSGLSCEMNDHVWGKGIRNLIEQILIFQHAFGHRKMRMLQEHRMAPLFQRDVIVVRHTVIAMHLKTFRQQSFCEMKPNEPGSTGNEDTSHLVNFL